MFEERSKARSAAQETGIGYRFDRGVELLDWLLQPRVDKYAITE
jgi:hypothetical protein